MSDLAPLRVLLLEDDDADAGLVMRELERSGVPCAVTRVTTGPEFERTVDGSATDLILSDRGIEGYDGMSALRWSRDRAPDVPFVFVSGSIPEEAAIDAMREGATDYVHKDRLFRLGPVVQRVRGDRALRSELAEIRAQHLRGQKLEAMGEMAGTVAHDFRNILTAMLGHAELLLMRLPPDDPARERLRTILAAGQRGVDLCAQLLAFGRQNEAVTIEFDPVTEIRRTEILFRSVLSRAIEMHLEVNGDVGRILANPGEMSQVLMNLLVNARDAMPDGGTVTLSIVRRTLSVPGTYVASMAPPGEYVEISVSDTGCGISEEIRQRIFVPHFTTKSAGKGTGLGLAIVYGIVRKAGGHLRVESAVGRGTTFRILFPRVVSPGESPAAAGPTRTVLVADDDATFREQLAQTLELAGFAVLAAGDGEEALGVAGRHGGRIELLLTDLHMPRMDGWELAGRFAALRPGAGILVMTGSVGAGPEARPVPARPVIRKPFGPHDLIAQVEALLAKPG